jgi:hypothetical protein
MLCSRSASEARIGVRPGLAGVAHRRHRTAPSAQLPVGGTTSISPISTKARLARTPEFDPRLRGSCSGWAAALQTAAIQTLASPTQAVARHASRYVTALAGRAVVSAPLHVAPALVVRIGRLAGWRARPLSAQDRSGRTDDRKRAMPARRDRCTGPAWAGLRVSTRWPVRVEPVGARRSRDAGCAVAAAPSCLAEDVALLGHPTREAAEGILDRGRHLL